MRLLRRVLGPFFALPAVTTFMRRTLPTLDMAVFRLSGGRFMFVQLVEPALVLEHVGARTGQTRVTPLLYARDGERWLLAGTNWGQAHHPAWTGNLLANPDAVIVHRGRRIPVRAEPIEDEEERERAWALLDDIYVGYRRYRAVTADIRQVRMFALTAAR